MVSWTRAALLAAAGLALGTVATFVVIASFEEEGHWSDGLRPTHIGDMCKRVIIEDNDDDDADDDDDDDEEDDEYVDETTPKPVCHKILSLDSEDFAATFLEDPAGSAKYRIQLLPPGKDKTIEDHAEVWTRILQGNAETAP